MKPYPAYKDSGIEWIGKIPEHWSVVRLKHITKFKYGSSLMDEKRIEGNVPVFGSNGITGSHNIAITQAPSIIIGRKGSFGKINYSEIPCYPIDTTYYIDNSTTNNNIRWIYFNLQILDLDSISKDSTVPGLNREEAYNKITIILSINEQKKISEFLDTKIKQIDLLISKKQRIIELLKEQRSAIINRAVTRGLNPNVPLKDSGIPWLGKIPEHWEVKKLNIIANMKLSGVDKKKIEGENTVELCNYLDVYNNDFITDEIEFMKATATPSEISNLKLNEGDLLITKDSESWNDIAIPAFVQRLTKNVICAYHLALIRPDQSIINGEYLFRAFCADSINFQFRIAANGITRYGLSRSSIKNALFPIPPLSEQIKIKDYLLNITFKIDKSISLVLNQISLLEEYRTTLISDVVTGKINVSDVSNINIPSR